MFYLALFISKGNCCAPVAILFDLFDDPYFCCLSGWRTSSADT